MRRPKAVRRFQLLDEEQGRLRALCKRGKRVQITYEAVVVDAWTTYSANMEHRLTLLVETPDGERHTVVPGNAWEHIGAASEETENRDASR